MNKFFFRLLVFLMSLSLIGIILVQVYWFNTSFKNNDEQFKFNAKQVISNVSENLQKQEALDFFKKYDKLKDSIGKAPRKSDLLQFYYVQKNAKTNQTIVYSSSLIEEDYNISTSIFDKNNDKNQIPNFSSNRKTEVFNGNNIDKISKNIANSKPDIKIEKSGTLDILKNVQFEIAYKDIAAALPLEQRISIAELQKKIGYEMSEYGIKTDFEFAIFSNGKVTNIKSEKFIFDKNKTFSTPVFVDSDGNNKYQLLASFPCKTNYLFSDLMAISILSIIFTLIIIIAYASAINQLIKQRLISEIKTDFINNMTHEFKTPIATINLALDAIKNPKVIDNKEMVAKYMQMIRDENKRMHAQVENVLRISKLEKKELDIDKESLEINELIQDAIEHVQLILEDKNGTITTNLNAKRNTCLLNDTHFTNVIVNILDNAIKYSATDPMIEVSTENVKDIIIIRIKDHGIGMTKIAQKRIFEKFYREHTGDLHNVKGHGLGLSYVKRIVDDHNGQIFVESEKSAGSTFIIKMPLIN